MKLSKDVVEELRNEAGVQRLYQNLPETDAFLAQLEKFFDRMLETYIEDTSD